MAVTALHSAATGLTALSREIDIIANNLSNVNTTGYKSMRANFEDLLYEAVKQPGLENANGDKTPAGLFVGLGTQISNTQFDMKQGDPISSNGELDMMIDGNGFFRLEDPDGDGFVYTRAGNFTRNSEGEIVLGNSAGPRLDGGITIDETFTDIGVSEDGVITAKAPDGTRQNLGQLTLVMFVNPNGLEPVGGNLLRESEASGPPIEGEPRQSQFGRILHKYREASNVDPVKELVSLIKTQRAFELNSQTIQTADQALQVISNLRRF